jgi:Holliday junction resolvasome RuvABC endonuclease subunit
MLTRYLPTGKRFSTLPQTFMIMSVDPGSKNFGFRIEKRSKNKIETIVMELLDIREDNMHQMIMAVTNMLDKLFWLLSLCHLFVIEGQISKLNPSMTILSQHLFTYLILRLEKSALDPIIYNIHSQCVKRYFKIPKGMGKAVKEPIKEIAVKILEKGQDKKGQEKYNKMKEAYLEHFADTIVMAEAVCSIEGYVTIL